MSLQWLKDRDKNKPFALMVHHKAPHREWEPDAKHADMYENEEILEPETFYDDYENRSSAAKDREYKRPYGESGGPCASVFSLP